MGKSVQAGPVGPGRVGVSEPLGAFRQSSANMLTAR